MTTHFPRFGLSLGIAMLAITTPLLAEGPGGFTDGMQASDGVLYSVNQITGELITIDPNSAAISVVGSTGFNLVEGLTYHTPTDSLLAVDNESDQLIAIDRQTGAGTAIGSIGRDFVFGLTYSEHNDTLYAYDNLANELLTLDPTSGTVEGGAPLFIDFVGGLTDQPETGVIFGVDFGNSQVFLIDLEGGLAGPIVDVGLTSLQSVAFDSTTGDLFAIDLQVGSDALLRIDPLSDTVNTVGFLESVSLASLEFVPTAVPEPSASILLFTAVAFLSTRLSRL
ncbi:NHL repeat-containing protein [Bythopirellula goksoeyrii]|uniref:PEP-CTERM protein-sorting domain-containing protein n=1 Tax=Bythopirellula goksoeyrii TaxID=1400387 RepID=A0A5B9QVQ8_9BACT|nr:hypothetical protein [Bythopirellula goksoeyrii]QEG38013.1 hypothetical protein Pr1d_53610 [Bythopirellula goksoeyrii]